jgi:hypothetical protein
MQAPRLRSMFRNVRTEPRRFEFKSRHLPDLDTKWTERKERIVAELVNDGRVVGVGQRPIRFRKSGHPNEGRSAQRRSQIKGARYAMLRAAMIAAVLVWMAWKGIQWVETSDFSGILKWMEDA